MKNKEVRTAIKSAGLSQWQVAESYGLNEGNFSRLLRREFSTEKKEKVMLAIERLINN